MRKKILISIFLVITTFISIFSTVYATDEQTEIPSKYDLRNDINIRIENQGQRGWCSAFAMTKTFETYILKTRGIDYNLSEAYLSYSEAPYFGGDVEWKTDITTARALVSNILVGKYALEKDIPNKDYEFNETNKKKFENAPTIIKDYDLEIFDKKDEKVDSIKKQIMNNGGVYLSMNADTKWYNPSTNAIYCNELKDEEVELNTREQVLKYVEETTGHAVTIIGWDDKYSRNNFNSNCRPENDGAWLILNSWGADWGNNGTAWVSYEDINFLNSIPFGIKSVKLIGELNANFSYEFNKLSNTVIAKIVTDEKVESIEGWKQYSEDTYNKEFTEYFEPYTIELKSKIDGATTKVEVNIPNEIFEEQKANSEIGNKKAEQREKELEELRSEKERKDLFLHKLDMIIYVGIGVLILVIVIFIFLSKNNKSKN